MAMKTILLSITLCLCALNAEPIGIQQMTSLIRPAAAGGGGGADVTENFEGTGYENSWTTAAGSPAPDTATTGLSLEGSECLYNNGNGGAAVGAYVPVTATDTLFAYFLLRFEDNPTAYRRFFGIKNSTTLLVDGETGPDGGGYVGIAGQSTSVTVDTTYHCWAEYEKGTGANAKKRFYISTTSTKPGTPTDEVTNGAETAQADRFYFETWATGGGNVYFDKLRISRTTAFGSAPP